MRKVDLENNCIINDIGVTEKLLKEKEDINMLKKNLVTIVGMYLATFGLMFIGIIWMFVKLITILFS